MKVRVLFFSVLRDTTGSAECEVELPGDAATVADLLDQAFQRWPALREWDSSLLIAVDHTYAKRGDKLAGGQEVAIMPPVQGG